MHACIRNIPSCPYDIPTNQHSTRKEYSRKRSIMPTCYITKTQDTSVKSNADGLTDYLGLPKAP